MIQILPILQIIQEEGKHPKLLHFHIARAGVLLYFLSHGPCRIMPFDKCGEKVSGMH